MAEIEKAWYVKYRPKTMQEYAGEKIRKVVEQRFKVQSEMPHVMLIQGTRGCGKTTFSRLIAKYYLCENPNEDGTFDICGRMDGPTVDLCYKMSKHLGLILINKYVLERDYSGYSTPLISRQDIVIYLPDYVVDEIETIWKTRPSESTLLTSLKASGYIKSTS